MKCTIISCNEERKTGYLLCVEHHNEYRGAELPIQEFIETKLNPQELLSELEETEHDLNKAISALREIYTILHDRAKDQDGNSGKERYAWLVAKDTLLTLKQKLPKRKEIKQWNRKVR